MVSKRFAYFHEVDSLALAPSDPQVLYAGTGEGNLVRYQQAYPLSSAPATYQGSGVLRSIDGGTTWTRQGADAPGRNAWTRYMGAAAGRGVDARRVPVRARPHAALRAGRTNMASPHPTLSRCTVWRLAVSSTLGRVQTSRSMRRWIGSTLRRYSWCVSRARVAPSTMCL